MNLSRMLLFITLSCMKSTGYFRPYRSLGEDSENSYVCISTWLPMQLFRKSYGEKMVSVARLPYLLRGHSWVYCVRYLLACLTCDIRLESSSKGLVHNAATICRGGESWSLATRVMVQHIQCRNEKLVCILLFVTCQMTCVSPHHMKQFKWYVRRGCSGVKLYNKIIII